MVDIVTNSVPCGFGPPGQLPPPLDDGLDGGTIFVPNTPSLGTDTIIKIPNGGDPGNPNIPNIPIPLKPKLIVPPTITTTEDTIDILFQLDSFVWVYGKVINVSTGQTVQVYNQPTIFQQNHLLTFTGLEPDTQYSLQFTFRKTLAFLFLNYSTTITTDPIVVDPPIVPVITNVQTQFSYQNNSIQLNVSFQTEDQNNNPILTNAQLLVNDGVNNQYALTSPQSTDHFIVIQNVLQGATYNLVINVASLNGETDTEILTPIVAPSPDPRIPTIVSPNAYCEIINGVIKMSVLWGTTFNGNPIGTIGQVTITNQDTNQNLVILDSAIINDQHLVEYNGVPPLTTFRVKIYSEVLNEGSSEITLNNVISPPDGTNSPQFTGQQYYQQLTNFTQSIPSEIDLKYTPYELVNTSPFLPTVGTTGTNLLKEVRHYSIDRILSNVVGTFEEANIDSANITSNHIEESLKDEFKKLYYLKYNNGIPIQRYVVNNLLKSHILSQTLADIDTDYLEDLIKNVEEQKPRQQYELTKKSGYGITRKELRDNRKALPTIERPEEVVRNKSTGYSLIRNKLVSINPTLYSDDASNLLKLWNPLSEDINKQISASALTGEISIPVKNTDSIQAYNSSGGLVNLYLTVNDTLQCQLEDGTDIQIIPTSDLHRAYTLKNEDEQLIMYHLGFDKQVTLTATSNNEYIELTSSVYNPQSHYVFKLNTSTIQESTQPTEQHIVDTIAEYTIVQDDTSSITSFNEDIVFTAYPWLVLTINHNDGIWEYIDYKNYSVSGNKFTFTFRDVSYKYLGFSLDDSDPIIVRKIPRYIVVLPTDRTKFDLFKGESVVSDWSSRTITWLPSPDASLNKVGLLTHPFNIQNSFLYSEGESKEGDFSTQSYICKYQDTSNYSNSYKNPLEVPERTLDPVRETILHVSSLKEEYVLDSGVTWYDVLNTLERPALYNLTTKASPQLITKLRNGDKTGVKIYHVKGPTEPNRGNERIPTRIVATKTVPTIKNIYITERPVPPVIDEGILLFPL
jgi:hypothetical protein